MYCKYCGQQIDDRAVFCVHCGVATDAFYYPPAAPGYPPVMQGYAPAPQKKTNGLSLAGMIVSIVGAIGGNYLLCIPSVVGIILSVIGLGKVKQLGSGKGFSIAGIIVGAVSLLIWILIFVMAFIELFSDSGGLGQYYY